MSELLHSTFFALLWRQFFLPRKCCQVQYKAHTCCSLVNKDEGSRNSSHKGCGDCDAWYCWYIFVTVSVILLSMIICFERNHNIERHGVRIVWIPMWDAWTKRGKNALRRQSQKTITSRGKSSFLAGLVVLHLLSAVNNREANNPNKLAKVESPLDYFFRVYHWPLLLVFFKLYTKHTPATIHSSRTLSFGRSLDNDYPKLKKFLWVFRRRSGLHTRPS